MFTQHDGLLLIASTDVSASVLRPTVGEQKMDRQFQQRRQAEKERQKDIETERAVGGCGSGGVGSVKVGGLCFCAYPSVPFLLGVLMVVPSGCWPSLRGGILSFILSRPRASSKLRIFLVGEKP